MSLKLSPYPALMLLSFEFSVTTGFGDLPHNQSVSAGDPMTGTFW
jgi:hypothetical protein